HAERQLVDEGILGAPQGRHVEPRCRQKGPRVHASAVRGVEHDRALPIGRLEDLEGRVELVFQFGHFASDVAGSDAGSWEVWHFKLGPRPPRTGPDRLFSAPLSLETRYCPWGQRRMAGSGGQGGAAPSPVIYPASPFMEQGKHGVGDVRPPSSVGWTMAKIILAEDDGDMRRFLVKALQNAGYDVISFDNGLSAYQRLREEPFELLLTDIVMPEMDGIQLARRASAPDPDI